jgi:hypothetical protein
VYLTFCGKAVSVAYSECLPVALSIQRAMRMLRIILSSANWLVLQYFLHYLIKGKIFEKKKSLNIKYVFLFDASRPAVL